MNRPLRVFLIAAGLITSVSGRRVWAGVDVDINIGVPPPPAVVFEGPPRVEVIPRTQVYYVPGLADYDMYRLGPYWYVNRDGYWYRSRAYGGPFRHVEYRYVPHSIVVVPTQYRRYPLYPHGGHPRHQKHYQHHGHGY